MEADATITEGSPATAAPGSIWKQLEAYLHCHTDQTISCGKRIHFLAYFGWIVVLLSLPVDPVLPYFALIAEDEVDGGPIVGYPEVCHLTVDVVEMEAECM